MASRLFLLMALAGAGLGCIHRKSCHVQMPFVTMGQIQQRVRLQGEMLPSEVTVDCGVHLKLPMLQGHPEHVSLLCYGQGFGLTGSAPANLRTATAGTTVHPVTFHITWYGDIRGHAKGVPGGGPIRSFASKGQLEVTVASRTGGPLAVPLRVESSKGAPGKQWALATQDFSVAGSVVARLGPLEPDFDVGRRMPLSVELPDGTLSSDFSADASSMIGTTVCTVGG